MVFNHDNIVKKFGKFSFSGCVTAKSNAYLNKPIIREFWNRFSFGLSQIKYDCADELVFTVGKAEILPVDGCSYAINVTESGVSISATTEKNLLYGFMTLIDMISAVDDGKAVYVNCCEIREMPLINKRMVHFCVFHNTQLWQIERFIRFCGALKYTHIVLEFWGMFKYDCLKELSWQEGYTKEQLQPLIKLANDLGIEIVPMLNHWGHASAGRVRFGKHVVLNQNPSLQYLFNDTGWCWDYKNPKTLELLKRMREEMIDLCGNGEYFHIGCDEAYGFNFSLDNITEICAYINKTADNLGKLGRKTIVWGDMFLSKRAEYSSDNQYTTNCPFVECEQFIQRALDKSIIIADWQYDVKKAPVETAVTLKNAGFEVMLCSWDATGRRQSVGPCCQTVIDNNLYGVMHTTWDTLSVYGMESVVEAAARCWSNESFSDGTLIAAAVLRKAYEADTYEKSGWKFDEVEV